MNDPARPSGTEGWPWSDSLDALQAAPQHHHLLFENRQVRVLDTCIHAGDRTPVHTHRWPAVHHVVSWSVFVRRDAAHRVLMDSRDRPPPVERPLVLWSEPYPPHTLENVGAADLEVISVELKYVPPSAAHAPV